MFSYFKWISISKNICTAICVALLLFSCKAYSQSLGDPIVNITFGSGTSKYAGALPADSGSTTYIYSSNTPNDNYYTIVNTSANTNGGWWLTTDHTGNPGGYFMIVNGSYTPGIFYTRQVMGLCGNTTYQFAAWIKSLLNYPGILPNVTFSIETTDGTSLGTFTTGDIPDGNIWKPYSFTFITPANPGTLVLKMINNAPGGIGNDIAIDDITFRPYGDPVSVVFDQSSSSSTCEGNPQTITINATSTLAANYEQKLQQKINGVWTDIGPSGTNQSFSVMSPSVAGVYPYRVVSGLAGNINTSQCVVSSNELIFTVMPIPTALFSVPDNTCLNDPTVFKDLSVSNGATTTVASWLWDFGDGQTSTEQNPSHVYASPGNYPVNLTVTNANGCSSILANKTIHINALPQAAFTVSTPDCETQAVTFTDISTTPPGTTITSRTWNFGDGTIITDPDNQPVQHTYASADNYNVTLDIVASSGCVSTKTISVTIHPLPKVDFTTPPSCVSDYTVFTDNTTIADNSNASFTYLWDFGDGSAKSTARNPVHKYNQPNNYTVTLTVTTGNGCQFTQSKPFTVNGATPIADFEVLNKDKLCSNQEVSILNKSSVLEFGNVTKVELYYDYDGDQTLLETDNNPSPGKIYSHAYPEFHTGTKQYKIRMVAYSGSVCFSVEKDVLINLLPTPVITYTQPPVICQNAGTIQLDAHDISNSGINGSGVYTGPGVSASGLFDPLISGTGPIDIQYSYKFNGTDCATTVIISITVDPAPVLDLVAPITILEGGSGTLRTIATGSGLTYKWLPATGLSSDTDPNPTVSIASDITYKVTVTNDKGCFATESVTVTVLKLPLIPNAFTPNGDGINDTWEIKYLDSYPGCTVDVFNRYGQKVFASVGYPIPWDGRMNGNNLSMGVYYYIINPKNGRKAMTGYITIIK